MKKLFGGKWGNKVGCEEHLRKLPIASRCLCHTRGVTHDIGASSGVPDTTDVATRCHHITESTTCAEVVQFGFMKMLPIHNNSESR